MDGTYDIHFFHGTGITFVDDSQELGFRLSQSGVWITTSIYGYTDNRGNGNVGHSRGFIEDALGNGSGEAADFWLYLYQPASTTEHKRTLSQCSGSKDNSYAQYRAVGGTFYDLGAVDGIKFFNLGGSNLLLGTIRHYGIVTP